MRNSNYLFTKGSIVFVKYPANSENAFLNGRPLIVVSNPSHILRTLLVVTTGTQDKPGIEASFYNHVDKCYVGDCEISHIYPYSIKTIYTDQIIASIGQLDPFIMAEVDKAIDFHLGRISEVPKYLEKCADEICGVSYNQLNEEHITKEIASTDYVPAVNYKRQYRKPETAPQSQRISKFEERMKKTQDMKISTKQFHQINSENKKESNNHTTTYTTDTILKWTLEPIKDINFSEICKEIDRLFKHLSQNDVCIICSRVVSLAEIMEKYGLSKAHASQMRATLTDYLVRLGKNLLISSGDIHKQGYLSEMYLLGLILANKFADIKSHNNIMTVYGEKIDYVITKYKINFDNKKIWKSI